VRNTSGKQLDLKTGQSDLRIAIRFKGAASLSVPSVGVTLTAGNGWAIASASSLDDGLHLSRTHDDIYQAEITFPRLALLKGSYWVNIFLLCEDGLHLYDSAERIAELRMQQDCRELGVVTLPRSWQNHSS